VTVPGSGGEPDARVAIAKAAIVEPDGRAAVAEPDARVAIAGLLGRPARDIEHIADLTHPWATATRTQLVTLEGGERIVVQRGLSTRAGRAAIARRIRLSRALRRPGAQLPVPEVLAGDPRAADGPWLASRFVDGRLGSDLLDSGSDAAVLGAMAGTVAAGCAGLSAQGLRLGRRWADPGRLTRAAASWLESVGGGLSVDAVVRGRRLVERVPELLAASPPVVAHGDLAPVNLVVAGGSVVAVLDLERMRLAPAALDAAWFRYLVRLHHPERSAAATSALLAARGLADDAATALMLDDLAALACLELAASVKSAPGRRTWLARLETLLAG